MNLQNIKDILVRNNIFNKVSIIILTFNNLDYTKKCIESIKNYTVEGSYEIIIVDNNSQDGTRSWLLEQQDLKLILNNENLGFPKGCNQGIKAAGEKNDILLLNNDIIVTSNWLTNMQRALYSSIEIGAVGPVSNSINYNQQIVTEYNNIYEMQNFAREFNVSDDNKWKETLKLIGYCMLIKREVINEVGLLDERFTPGNFEDDDYSFRIIEGGYKLLLCRDTFIHHYGSMSFNLRKDFNEILKLNSLKFKDKWGFSLEEKLMLDLTYEKIVKEDSASVYEFNCGCGDNLINIKNCRKNSLINGYDDNNRALNLCNRFFEPKEAYDYVLISNVKSVDELSVFLDKSYEFVHENSKIIISFYNNRCIKRIFEAALNNSSLDFNLDLDILELIKNEKVNIKEIYVRTMTKENADAFTELVNTFKKPFEDIYVEKYYLELVLGKRKNIEFIIKKIDNKLHIEENMNLLLNEIKNASISEQQLIESIVNAKASSELINNIAVLCYNNGYYDYVIPVFKQGLIMYPDDTLLILNYCDVLISLEEYDECDKYIHKISIEEASNDKQFLNVLNKCNNMRNVKFALINIDDDIDALNCLEQIFLALRNKLVNEENIIEYIDKYVVNKEKVLNQIAVYNFNNENYEYIIPFLDKAHNINPNDYNTVFNLISILIVFDEEELAYRYYKMFKDKDNNLLSLFKIKRGSHE